MKKNLLFVSSALAVGMVTSGGIVFASASYQVTALSNTGTLNVNGRKLPISELYYRGVHYYDLRGAQWLLNNAKVSVSQNYGDLYVSSPYSNSSVGVYLAGNYVGNVPELSSHGVPYVNTSVLFNDFNKLGVNTSISPSRIDISLPLNLPAYPPGSTVSLFNYPHFALGNSNQTGSTTIYNDFVDNLGNKYTLPTLSWNVSAPASTSTSTSNTTTNSYPLFYPTQGNNGTFSMIYNLFGKYKGFSATLAPSAYFNDTTINSDTGSLEIDRGDGSAMFTSGNISSGNLSPTRVYVSLNGVKQIQVTFVSNGLGLINPVLIKK